VQKKKYSERFFNQLIKSWWVKVPTNIFIFVITVVSAFLEFRNAGLTTLFWGLFAASTAIVLLNIAFIVIPLVKEWLKEKENKKAQQKTFLDYRSKITILYSLIEDLDAYKKTLLFKKNTRNAKKNIKAVTSFWNEDEIKVTLNVGEQDKIQPGTKLLVYRTDGVDAEGHQIERRIALVQVTYIQAKNNVSHAVIERQIDQEFWEQITGKLSTEKQVHLPSNFAVPYIPKEIENLSEEDVEIFRQYLLAIYNNLIQIGFSGLYQSQEEIP